LLALWVFLPAGCAPRHPPLPLDSPEESAAAAPDSAPAVGEEDAVTTIEEEPLPDEGRAAAAPSAGEPAADALAVDPPALAQTIDAGTAPNVAAATRLVDAGRARMAAADYGTALELLERAIAVDSENPYAYYYLAELHFIHHTYDQAIAFADRAAGLSEARAPDWASRAYTLQGNAFEAAGRFADARDAYTRAIEAAPGNLAAQVGLARVGSPAVPAP
jgi:tetratricopeptide (TPR) repeat protein